MPIEHWIARAFAMDEATWQRHANPWSVWTRYLIMPLLVLAIWSRAWIGWWSLLPIGLILLWTWVNPRAFPPPRAIDNWASKGVMGERLWLNRARVRIPPRHRVVPHVLSAIALLGAIVLTWGLIRLELWPTIAGTAIVYLAKTWFVDRMVWLYEDAQRGEPPGDRGAAPRF